nr:MAG TPA: hypothetical protein [Caudoviricetes sp.]
MLNILKRCFVYWKCKKPKIRQSKSGKTYYGL